jgi:hypothetical protein
MTYSIDSIMGVVVGRIGAGAVPHSIGLEALSPQASPPRVVWVEAAQESYDAPVNMALTSHGGNNPRTLWTVKTPVEIHIWAETKEQFDAIRQSEVAALHAALSGSYRLVSGRRMDDDNRFIACGYAYILVIEIHQPIVDKLVPVVTVTAVSHDVVMDFGNSHVHCGHQIEPPVEPAP